MYAVDLLGQGDSWPTRPQCEDSGPLRFSADTWTEQLYHFIEEKIGEPAYVAGNSLGGYLGVHLAAKHPHAVRGLVLLNATPFWSQRPPLGQERGLLWRALRDVDAAVPIKHVRACVCGGVHARCCACSCAESVGSVRSVGSACLCPTACCVTVCDAAIAAA